MSHTTTVKTAPIRDLQALNKAVQELKASGVNASLERNAVPRMYYADQLQRHMKQSSEVCDWVLRLPDAYYDVGFLKNPDGSYYPVFDDYNHASSYVPGTSTGRGPIRDFLGAAHAGKVEHWSGPKEANDKTLHSIGRLLQGYTAQAVLNRATADGFVVQGMRKDAKTGEIHIVLAD